MSGIKGFPSQEKLVGKLGSYDWQQVQTQMEFVTAQKSSSKKIGLDTVVNGLFRVSAVVNVVDAVPTAEEEQNRVIYSTAHGALPGDVIRFEASTANPYFEAAVLSTPDADTLILGSGLPNVPNPSDQFYVLRYVSTRYSDDGAQITSQGPLQYVLNGIVTQVLEDTIVPGNNTPLPVKLMGTTGPINITAGDLNVQLSDQGVNADVTKVGDGTNRLGITASNEAKVSDATLATAMTTLNAKDFATAAKQDAQTVLLTSIAGEDFATQTTLAALLTELQLKADLTETQPVSAASLPLPTGAATEATLAAIDTKLGGTIAVSGPLTDAQLRATAVPVSGTFWQATQPISAAALPLPADAATETTLAAASAKLPATLGQKTSANSLAVVMSSDAVVPSAKGRTKVAMVTFDHTLGSIGVGTYSQAVSSTSADINMIEVFDSSGEALALAVGNVAAEVQKFYIMPGGNGQVPFNIPSGSRVSITAITAAPTAGRLLLNFLS